MAVQPSGTVTMLFSDVEGSTQLLARLGAKHYAEVLEQHNGLLRQAFARHGGYEVDTAGDSFFVSFSRVGDAASAAQEAQRSLADATWPDGVSVRVRMAIHTGEPLIVDSKYVGMDVHRAARIMAAAHGGQVLVSETTAPLLDGIPLRDLGLHRLKDLLAPIRLHQLLLDGRSDEFPPPRSLYRTNLPTAVWPLVGRERELEQIRALISDEIRLVTLTGSGGAGKTRLALQVAAELSDDFPDGVYFVPLAALREASMVVPTIAQQAGLQLDDDLMGALRSKRTLLVLDNLEHLRGIASVVADVLVGKTTIVATSRTPLRLSGERELVVDPLPDDAAIELFVSRAAASGREVAADETVAAVCRRLDNLPLALELAAARVKLLSPSVLLQRLDSALPLLTGGGADRPERQRTLRATIEWSHDLLDPAAQAAFRRLSVFRGAFTLEAAEGVTGADLDRLGALLDQSLLKPLGEDRLFMLETLREYARERLDEAVETTDFALRHADWFLAELGTNYQERLGFRRAEILAWYDADADNLRAMLDRLSSAAPNDAARAAFMLHSFWRARGEISEEYQRLRALLDLQTLTRPSRAALLVRLSDIEMHLGQVDASGAIAREALALAEPRTEPHWLAIAELAFHALQCGDTEEAVRLAEEGLGEADALDDAVRVQAIGHLAAILAELDRAAEARPLYERLIKEARRSGFGASETVGLSDLGRLDLLEHDFAAARTAYASALDQLRRSGEKFYEPETLRGLGLASLGLGQRSQARATFAELLDLALAATETYSLHVAQALSGIALAVEPDEARRAARLRGAVAQLSRDSGVATNAYSERMEQLEHHFEHRLILTLGGDAWERTKAAGATLTLEEAIFVARSLCESPQSLAAS